MTWEKKLNAISVALETLNGEEALIAIKSVIDVETARMGIINHNELVDDILDGIVECHEVTEQEAKDFLCDGHIEKVYSAMWDAESEVIQSWEIDTK